MTPPKQNFWSRHYLETVYLVETEIFLLKASSNSIVRPMNSTCRDKGPKSYIKPWALSEDVEWSEERHIFSRCSNLKSHE